MSRTDKDYPYSVDLADIVVGETAICAVDGEAGELSYRGIPVAELAARPYTEVLWLLLFGDWPDADQLAELEGFLAAQRELGASELTLLEALPTDLHPMLVLQAVVPTLGAPEQFPGSLTADLAQGLSIAAKLPSLLTAWQQLRRGAAPLPSDPSLSINADFLRMLHGETPTPESVQTLDCIQILQLEHGFNVSTFVSRICASTEAPLTAIIAAATGTLFGKLHGGADEAVLEMARALPGPDAATDFVRQSLADKIKIMGMGSREYRVMDPRARVLKPMAETVCTDAASRRLLTNLQAIEAACREAFAARNKPIHPNLEFYKGVVLHQLGIPDDYFTAVFTMARAYSWVAHYREFKPHSRLIRPRARYL